MIDFNPRSPLFGGTPGQSSARLYKCPVCDTVVELLDPCGLEITCCGPQMVELTERVSSPQQPHALVVERAGGMLKVRVGGQPHPMEDGHYISWIEVTGDGQCCRQFLRPGESPEACFHVETGSVAVRAYCSAHGLWRSADGRGRKVRRMVAAAVA